MTSTSYPQDGRDWRGRFIFDLAAALGHQPALELALWAPPGELPPQVSSVATTSEERWLHQLSQRGGIAHLLRTNKPSAMLAALNLLRSLYRVYRRESATVVHVNWLQNALPLWGTRTPAVVSVLGTDFRLMRMPGMTYLLRQVFRQRHTLLAPNAEWMVPELQRRFGDVAEVQAVPFGIDAAWFRVQRRSSQKGPQRWLVVSRLTKAKIGDLFDWGAGLFGQQRELHVFGPMQEQLTLPEWVHYHGPTHPAELLTHWFPQATGLLTLSRHDEGRPQVMLEAMAATLPIVASDILAHQSIVQHGVTGWLVREPGDLTRGLSQLEDITHNHRAGLTARQWAVDAVGTWDDCAARYVQAYCKVTGTV